MDQEKNQDIPFFNSVTPTIQQLQDSVILEQAALDSVILHTSTPTAEQAKHSTATTPSTICGAGILCYSIPPYPASAIEEDHFSNIYFLLAKEQSRCQYEYLGITHQNQQHHNPSQQQNSNTNGNSGSKRKRFSYRNSNRWSDCGGRHHETIDSNSIERTAAREFIEESLGVVCCMDDEPYDYEKRIDHIAQALQRGEYTLRIDLVLESDPQRKYILFLKQVPWDPAVHDRFQYCMYYLHTLRDMQRYRHDLETALGWNRQLVLTTGPEQLQQPQCYLPRPGSVLPQLYIPTDDDGHSTSTTESIVRYVESMYIDERTATYGCRLVVAGFEQPIDTGPIAITTGCMETVRQFQQWVNVMNDMYSFWYNDCPDEVHYHPAITYEPTQRRLNVHPEFLEKKSIQWWNADRANDVCRYGGRHRKERFKSNFVPLLQLCCDFLRLHQPSD